MWCCSPSTPSQPVTQTSFNNSIDTLKKMEWGIRIAAITAIGLFILTIVFLGLAQAGYIHPVAALYSVGAIIPMVIIAKCVDHCQEKYAKMHNIDLSTFKEAQKPKKKEE